MFEIKPLAAEAIPSALEKAVRYRLLGEPEAAESICRDVLRRDPDRQDALVTLVLALSDQLKGKVAGPFERARELLPRLEDEYQRAYYTGILYERRAMAHLRGAGMGSAEMAYDWFRQAMEAYERAETLAAPDNPDAVLRWNTCARIINRTSSLEPQPEDRFIPLLE